MPLSIMITIACVTFFVWLIGCPITDVGVWKNAGPIDHRCWIWPILLIRYLISSYVIRPIRKGYHHLGNREYRRMEYKIKHAEECMDLAFQWKKDSAVYLREGYLVSAEVTMMQACFIANLGMIFLEEGKPKETHLALRAPDDQDGRQDAA